jgi:branched-chain amino acid transport system substrate-binding protein
LDILCVDLGQAGEINLSREWIRVAEEDNMIPIRRYFLWVMGILGVLLAALIGCDQSQKISVRTIKVGVIYPLTGASASVGLGQKQAVELATEMINNAHELDLPLAKGTGLPGIEGAKIELLFGDSQGLPEVAASEAERLLSAGVVAMVGCYQSSVTASASQVAEGKGIPFLNPDSSGASLTQRGYQWFFRTTADDRLFVENFFEFLKDVGKRQGKPVKDVALVYENSLFGTGVAKLESQFARTNDMTIVADVPYSAKTASVEAEVKAIIVAAPQVILQASYDDDAILFMQSYKANNYRPQAILAMDAGFISPKFIQSLGADADYILSREVSSPDVADKKPVTREIFKLFRQRYGSDMTGNSARAFTGLMVLAEAINRAGSTRPEAIRKALLATHLSPDHIITPWDGVRFDPVTGQNVLAKGIIVQFQDGAYRIVWPWDMATRELVWPMPAWPQ